MTPLTYSSTPERATRPAASLFVPAGIGSRCEWQGSRGTRPHQDQEHLILTT